MDSGFQKVKVEEMLSPKAQRFVLKEYCSTHVRRDEDLTPRLAEYANRHADNALDFLKGLPGPIRFRGCGGYSYTFDPSNPFQVRASDGGIVTLKFISDLDEYAGYEGEFIISMCEEMTDLFDTGYVDQENHETEMLGGTPEKTNSYWG